MKIIHKGMLLVAIPLIFGMVFVSLLMYGLDESNRIFQHELLLKDAMITDNVTTRCTFAARICAMSYIFTREAYFKKAFFSNMKEASSSYKRLQHLLKNEPGIRLPAPISRRELVMGNPSYLLQMNAFMKQLQDLTNQESASAIKAMNWLQVVLISGMLLSVAITVGLAVFFCLNITKRLLIILNNTMSLSVGSPLSPPLKGTDEIAELDQLLFKSSNELKSLERFKKEMIGVVSHELKSPLSSVEVFLSSLRGGVFGDLSKKELRKVEQAHHNVLRLMALVKELLHLQKNDAGIDLNSTDTSSKTFWSSIPASVAQNSGSEADKPAAKNKESNSSGTIIQLTTEKLPEKSTRFRPGSFSVMQKGLIIVAVPLIFQYAFVSVIGVLLFQVRQHVQREENSKDMLDSLNRIAQEIVVASNAGMMYVYTRNKNYLEQWKKGKATAFKYVERLKTLSSSNEIQDQNIKESGESFRTMSVVLDNLIRSNKHAKISLDELRASGFGGYSKFKSFFKDSGTIDLIQPFLKGLATQATIMSKEKEIGEELSTQRSEMINTAKMTLAAGFVLNIILSSCLAVYLIRNLTSRLKHVNQNMARLVKREALLSPVEGCDEIAFLDQILFLAGRRLVELETFKRELTSIVSHELRTPLLSISSSLEQFSEGELYNLTSKGKLRLAAAREETDRLIRLINDLLDIEKMEAGRFMLEITETNVADLIKASIDAVAPLAEEKDIRLESTVSPGVWPLASLTLAADYDRLRQVLINLLSNAIKFSANSSSIQIAINQTNTDTEFMVIDQGRGIPEGMKENIFDRFFQVERTDAIERGGSGLGLAIAKAIVEQHGGTIGVQSKVNCGSKFWFRLPRSIQSHEPVVLFPAAEKAAVIKTVQKHRRGRIQQSKIIQPNLPQQIVSSLNGG